MASTWRRASSLSDWRPSTWKHFMFGRSSTWTHVYETWSRGGKIWKRRPCILVWTVRTPSPSRSTSSLQPFNPTTSHDDNSNNGRLRACAAEDIEPIRVTRTKYSAHLPLRWAKGLSSSSSCVRFLFYCLFVYNAQASALPFLVNFKRHL